MTWISDGDTFAVLDDPSELTLAQRDGGWAPAADPPDDAWVFIWLAGVEQPGRVPVSALRELWGPRGWAAGPPPGGTHPAAPKPAAVTAAPKSSKSAAAAEVKENTGG